MEPLSWTGTFGTFLNPLMLAAVVTFFAGFLANFAMNLAGLRAGELQVNPDHTLTLNRTPVDYALLAMKWSVLVFLGCCVLFVLGGLLLPELPQKGIIGAMGQRLWPVWLSLGVLFAASIAFKRRLGLYGKLFDSPIGMVGFALVMFWMFTAIFAGSVITHAPLEVISQMRNEVPGTFVPHRARAPIPSTFWAATTWARRLQPHGHGRARGAEDRAGGHALRLHGGDHAGPSRGLFRRKARHRADLSGQPRSSPSR
jgi:peptide/nickel transport system permease protein